MKKYAAKIRKLDALVQKWACRQVSYVSGYRAECGHHYIGRANLLLRWNLKNIIPLTMAEHRQLHDGNLNWDISNPFRKQVLINMKNKGLKSYLLEKGLTLEDFLKERETELLEALKG